MKTRQWILSLALGLTLILPLFAHAAATDAGGMLQFDSDALQQDRVTVPYNAAQDLSANFTLEFWVKAADFSNEPRLLQRKDAFALFLTTSGNVKFESKNGTMVAVTSSATLSLNSWHHIAVTVEDLGGGNFQAQIYIDGVLDASNTDALFQIPWAAEPLMIGNQQNGSGPLEGWMDDVRIWSEVRSTAQIADNRGKALEGTEANLVSYYNFDETGQTVNDLTGTQDGVLGTDATVEDSDPTRVAISTAPIGIRLLSPNGGESYPIGTAFTVTWACDPAVPQVDVLLSMDGGVNWLFLAKATNNDGSLQAYAPGPPTTQAVIMLLNTTDPNQNDAGDGFFSTTEVPNWQVNIYKEAEDGVLTKPMMRAIDGLSFNCYQIYSYKNNVGTAVLQVNLPISGIYVIWGRTYSEGGTRNSFYISVDGGPEALYDIKKNSSWNWAPVSERGNALAGTTPEIAPVLYYLTAGTHEITIRGRENYARFDRLAITNNLQQDFYWLNPDRWILLTAPEDKAQVERGKPVEITWESYNISSVVTIDASFDHLNSFPLLIAQSTPNDGAFIWNVPANLNYEIAYIRITSGSSAGSCPMDANYQQFYLVDPKPELNVLQPNGGEKWVAGSTEQISWASEFYSGTVNIDFSTDNGATWTQIAAAQPAGGTLDWTIPNTPSTTCWVRAYNSGGGAPSDTSDAAFEIVAPPQPDETLTVIAPNGGENLTGGNSFAIQWEAENLSDPVNIDVSIDNGTTWSTIATGQSPTGSYAWTVPTLNVDNAWVRVYEPTDSVPADTSDASFSIVTGGPLSESITVVYPNGGETLQIGSTIDIQWQSENFSGTVDVAVSLDNGATWSTIATAQPAIGSVAWSVPDISTQLGWVKVFDTADEDPIDLSDAPFAIAPALPMPTNYGLSFDGVDDLVEVAHDPSLNVSEQFTIEFWIKTENPTQNWTRVLEKGSWDEYYIGFYGNRARMHGALRTDLGNGYSRMTIPLGPSYSVMQPDQWYHVAATYDINTQQAVIYVNGVLEVTKTAVASPRRLLGDLIIGAVKRPVGEDFYYEGHLDAVLDELRIWNIARTDVEITDLMFVELMGGEEGLVAYYPFDEGSGQVAHDMTGNSNHGRLGLTEEEDSADPTWVEITDRPLGPASLPAKQWVDYAADEGLDFAEALPEEFELHPNFPNPFNAGTTISFTVPMTREGAVEVTVNIYDLRGQLIKQLVRGTFESGTHTYKWDGSAEDGIVATSGVYFYRMVAGDYVETRRMLMLK